MTSDYQESTCAESSKASHNLIYAFKMTKEPEIMKILKKLARVMVMLMTCTMDIMAVLLSKVPVVVVQEVCEDKYRTYQFNKLHH